MTEMTAPAQMSSLEKLGEILFRLRDYTPIPLLALMLIVMDPTPGMLVVGLMLMALGEAVRIYGVAFIGTISRTRSYSNGELVTSGPYAILRNPLYLGNLLLTLGIGFLSGVSWMPVLFVVFFYAQYIPIVSWEEMKLRRIFGHKYTNYCEQVRSRWIPPLHAFYRFDWYKSPSEWKPALRSEKRTLTSIFLAILLTFTLFTLKHVWNPDLLPLAQWIPFVK